MEKQVLQRKCRVIKEQERGGCAAGTMISVSEKLSRQVQILSEFATFHFFRLNTLKKGLHAFLPTAVG